MAKATKGKKRKKDEKAPKKPSILPPAEEDDEATEIEDNLDEDEEFQWPKNQRGGSLPSVSDKHRQLIERFRERKEDGNPIIESDPKDNPTGLSVYDIMILLDFEHFYWNPKDEWVEHCAVVLERTLVHVKPKDRILVFPLNTYYSVCLAIAVGPEGGVVCFGHIGNTHTMEKAGLRWMLDDYRCRFTNMTRELYFGKPTFQEFLEEGWPQGAPYDLIIMSDQPLNPAILSQLKPGGKILRPDLEESLMHESEGLTHDNGSDVAA